MTGLAQRLRAVLGISLIFLFFSEFAFVNEEPVSGVIALLHGGPDLATGILIMIGFYLLPAYVFLILLSVFRVQSLAMLYLAASLMGWTIEGIIVPAVYEAPPASLVWTSISWHTFIDVGLGWYLTGLAMRRLRPLSLVAFLIVLGVAWGLWGTWYWGSEPGSPAPLNVADFAGFAVITAAVWAIGMALADRSPVICFAPGRGEIVVVGLICTGLAIIAGLNNLTWLPVFLLLIAATLWVMWYGRGTGGRDRLSGLDRPPAAWRYALIALVPLAASLCYRAAVLSEWQIPTEIVVLALFTLGLAGFVLAMGQTILAGYRMRAV